MVTEAPVLYDELKESLHILRSQRVHSLRRLIAHITKLDGLRIVPGARHPDHFLPRASLTPRHLEKPI